MTTLALPGERKVLSLDDLFAGMDRVLEKRLGGSPVATSAVPSVTLESPAWLKDLSAWGQKVTPVASWDYIQKRPSGEFAFLRQADLLRNQWTTELHQGYLAPIENAVNSAFPKVPLGSIALGGVIGLVTGEVIDGMVAPRDDKGDLNMANPVTKIVVGILYVTLGKIVLTPLGTLFAAGILAVQVLADFLPINKWVEWILEKLKKTEKEKTTEAKQFIPFTSNSFAQGNPTGSDSLHDRLAHTF